MDGFTWEDVKPVPVDINWYTKGFKMDCFTGCELVHPDTRTGREFSLGKFSTVFQGGLAAILECAAGIERIEVEGQIIAI